MIPPGSRNKHRFSPRANVRSISDRKHITVDLQAKIAARLVEIGAELDCVREEVRGLLANFGGWDREQLDKFKDRAERLIRIQATVDALQWVMREAGLAE